MILRRHKHAHTDTRVTGVPCGPIFPSVCGGCDRNHRERAREREQARESEREREKERERKGGEGRVPP